MGHTASWWVSLEPQWLMIINLLQRENKNQYDSTVTNILGDDALNRCLKNPREGQDDIFLNQHISGVKEVMRY